MVVLSHHPWTILLIIEYMDSNLKINKFFSVLLNEIINTKISFSSLLLFFCFSEILALQWGSFQLLVEWQMMMGKRPWLPHIYIYIYIESKIKKFYYWKKRKDSIFLLPQSSLFIPSSINIMNPKQNLFLLEIHNSSILLEGVSMNSFFWINIL